MSSVMDERQRVCVTAVVSDDREPRYVTAAFRE
jgi:hypothetical protein